MFQDDSRFPLLDQEDEEEMDEELPGESEEEEDDGVLAEGEDADEFEEEE